MRKERRLGEERCLVGREGGVLLPLLLLILVALPLFAFVGGGLLLLLLSDDEEEEDCLPRKLLKSALADLGDRVRLGEWASFLIKIKLKEVIG